MTTPEYSSGTSIETRSTGSSTLPSTSRVTTRGFPMVSSNPSRRIISARTANCISPRPCTSHVSGCSVSRTRSETLPSSSRSRRSLIIRAVSFDPLRPASGLVFIATVTDRLGSSMTISGSGRGSSASAIVSPIVIPSIPATAMISPGPAESAATRSSPSVTRSSVSRTLVTSPSARHQATVVPRATSPSRTRQTASRPRYGEASRFATCAWSGWSAVYVGAGMCSTIRSSSGRMLSPGAARSSVAVPSRALV